MILGRLFVWLFDRVWCNRMQWHSNRRDRSDGRIAMGIFGCFGVNIAIADRLAQSGMTRTYTGCVMWSTNTQWA